MISMFNVFPSQVSQMCLTKAYSEPSKISKNKFFAKLVID